MQPVRLEASFREKVWGSRRLAPLYPDSDLKIGEVWFEATPPLPLLIKFIFTSEALSVQVHPDDEYARIHESSPGKTEMWHIVRADPGARIAIGLREQLTRQRLRHAAETGEIEHLLNWVEVHPGDTFHIPAGTIHAIGAGLALCEIQQQSDVTYRLYDYGRPRKLHLERAMDVSMLEPWKPQPAPAGFIAHCRYYATEVLTLSRATEYVPLPARFEVLIVLEGSGQVGEQVFRPGEAWLFPAGSVPVQIAPYQGARFLKTYIP